MIAKRLFDLLVSGIGLLVLAPFIAVLALLVRIKLGSPVLFRQQRPGLNGRPFMLVKFRTMLPPSAGRIHDDERMTSFGRFLRSTSLDELPELWNVVKGDMSLVGPRPLLMRYLDRYSPDQARRHDVRPGLTGWSQVNGRNALSWPEKLALDTWYVDHRSFALDLKILLMTVGSVLRRSGISSEGSETMPEFMGDEGPVERNVPRRP